jgi:holin-like protein
MSKAMCWIPAERQSGTPTPGNGHATRLPASLLSWGAQVPNFKTAGIFTLQIAGLWLVYHLNAWAVARFHLPVPGNVLGMLVLFALLMTGVVKLEWVAGAADLLTKHLAFFFIPVAVGLMQWGDLLWHTGHWLLLAIVLSTLAGLATTGGLLQLVAARQCSTISARLAGEPLR